jgi:enterochelin esterase-like enzyme
VEEVTKGQVSEVSVHSQALGMNKPVKIYTPYGYSATSKYPVLYLFHTGGGDQNTWMPKLGLETRADQLIRDKKIRPLIIVAPQMGEGYSGGGNEEFVSKELIHYDTNCSTDPTRENRFIGGLSMGGFIALHHAFFRPDLFSKVGGHSPYLYTEIAVNDAVENPIVTAKTRDLTALSVYLDAGIADPFNLVATNAELYRALFIRGVASENHPKPGGHDGAYWKGNLDDYLMFYVGK